MNSTILTEQLQMLDETDLRRIKSAAHYEIKRRGILKKEKRAEQKARLRVEDFDKVKDFDKAITELNSSALLEVPRLDKLNPYSNAIYLEALIAQDWSEVYPSSDDEGIYYVYAHVDPRGKLFSAATSCGGSYGGEPFYIGKGTGRRAYDLKRNQGHGKRIRNLLDDGYGQHDIVRIIFANLSESKALELESKLIYFFGTTYQRDRGKPYLLNLEIPKVPEFTGVMQKYLNSERRRYYKEKEKARRREILEGEFE